MRQPLLVAAALVIGVAPAFAQTATGIGPRTLRPFHVTCTDLPVSAVPSSALTVAGPHLPDGRQGLTAGDSLVIRGGAGAGLAVGQRYIARRLRLDETVPRPGEGYVALHTSGILVVTAVDADTAIARVELTCDPVEAGDYLEPYVEAALPAAAGPMGEPRFDDRAQILFGVDHRVNFANGDVLNIDRGTAQGVGLGARYAIYRDMHNGLPLVHVAEAVVVEAAESTAKVLLVSVTDAVSEGDIAVPRRTP